VRNLSVLLVALLDRITHLRTDPHRVGHWAVDRVGDREEEAMTRGPGNHVMELEVCHDVILWSGSQVVKPVDDALQFFDIRGTATQCRTRCHLRLNKCARIADLVK